MDVTVEQKPFTLAGVRHIGQLMRGDVQLLRQNLPVTGSLIQHVHEVRVFEDVLYLAAGQEILTFCVMPVGMPPHLRKRFQISTE